MAHTQTDEARCPDGAEIGVTELPVATAGRWWSPANKVMPK
jgi:hypothetical protein